MSDQTDPGTTADAAAGQGTGAPGSQSPEDAAKALADVKADNAKLREERRADRAKLLALENGLTPTEAELISHLPADQQAGKVEQLKAERAAAGGAANPTPPNPEDAAAKPADVTASAGSQPDTATTDALASGGEAAPGNGPSPEHAGNLGAQMNAEVLEAIEKGATMEQVQEIQAKYQNALSGQSL